MAVTDYFPRQEFVRSGYTPTAVDYLSKLAKQLQALQDIATAQGDITTLQAQIVAAEAELLVLEEDVASAPLFERPGGALAFTLASDNAEFAADSPWHGFGWANSGSYTNSQVIGRAIFAKDLVFRATDSNSYLRVSPGQAPTADAVFRFLDLSLSTLLGTFTIPAGTLTGTLAWATDPYRHAAGAPIIVLAPTPADTTLGGVTAIVDGQPS